GGGTPPATATAPRRGGRWIPRAAVLGTLAAATIAAPFASGHGAQGTGTPAEGGTAAGGPSTLEIVRQQVAAPATSAGIAAAPRVARPEAAASRSEAREALPDCDTNVTVTSENGHLTAGELCDLWQDGEQLQPRAADALTALNQAFRAEFGRDILLVDSYRSLDRQVSVKASRGSFAARPGTSMHGWGLAIDLSSQITGNSEYYQWLLANGAAYGWENPPWAQSGGSGSYEPWHFEFRPGVEEISTWH
uniref:M15 family metallopeptidase n=1 Tax=Puerhibacterium puerhi TaxID=2692623 RepID=UPI001357D0ED